MSESTTDMIDEKPFQFYIQTIGRGQKRRRSLTQIEARNAMRMILTDKVSPMQLGAFLMLIRVREETAEEAAGFVAAIREKIYARASSIEPTQSSCLVDIDWGSYAGKRRQLPWFMLALTLLARKGYTVFLHGIVGNEPHRLYTQEIAELLEWPMADSLEHAKQILEETGFCYAPVEQFAPEINTLMGYRDELGLRSPIHTLARMMNPFVARLSVHGVFHKGYDDIHQQAMALLNDPLTAAFCGDSGEAEVRPDRKTEIKMVENGLNEASSDMWSFFLPKVFFNSDPTEKCIDPKVLMAVWKGQETNTYAEAAVVHTMVLVLMSLEHLTLEEAKKQATLLWESRL
ncbi:Anthranilate phosphoribosyltransferase like [hydrothermal vent metagenome]|uniref:Anthranilate phosphoribosyltransferase like n=1 Tax=hydrothermal vent metagenome TaxID=652676 RepID=A0A3B0WG08_9ZZZZ